MPATSLCALLDRNNTDSITPSKFKGSPHSRPARVFAQYLVRISPPPITPTKLQNCPRVPAPYVKPYSFFPRFLLPQLVEPRKRAAFAFRNILCILTSAVDTRVGRPSRRPAMSKRAASGFEDESRPFFWAGVCARLLPMINARAKTIGGRSCLSLRRCPVKQRWERGP